VRGNAGERGEEGRLRWREGKVRPRVQFHQSGTDFVIPCVLLNEFDLACIHDCCNILYILPWIRNLLQYANNYCNKMGLRQNTSITTN
jgi:hypothetical protein